MGKFTARRPGSRIDPEEAFSEIRYVLSQGETSVAVLLNLGDMLSTDAKRFAEPERRALMILKKALLESSIVLQGEREFFAILQF